MSRRVYLLGVGLVLVALALAFTDRAVRPPFGPGVTEANARRIRPGMTLAEVEKRFGARRKQVSVLWRRSDRAYLGCRRWWEGERVRIKVVFGQDDRVANVNVEITPIQQADLLSRLRAWLGW
jgi:hypothetical protein